MVPTLEVGEAQASCPRKYILGISKTLSSSHDFSVNSQGYQTALS